MLVLTLAHSTLTHRLGEWSDAAQASITTSRAVLDAILLRKTSVPEAMTTGALAVEGNASKLALLFGLLDQPASMMFDILTPGEGR
jgi:alkyl sulfatase BDS1-like metallo-beta-lactamase superfamily hydrolase